ncbi:hypothetical protein CBS101457_000389 [Exobasidium rhododendri]|nr:hypothetical protein CBS101457_000389 [Exobasidium rhododendri]
MPGLKRPLHKEDGRKSSNKKPRPEARPERTSSTSNISAHEVDFPRGGGSTLTPFEHQQVLREVKAETSAAKKARNVIATSDDLFTDGDSKKKSDKQKQNRDRNNATKKKSVSGGKSAIVRPVKDEDRPQRIEVLNYKRLATGTRMLCSVLAIHPLAVVLSMPNQLLGHVPITNISDIFTSRLEGATEESDDESDEEESGSESSRDAAGKRSKDVPELREIFEVGQWVVASVVSVQSKQAKTDRGREGGEYEQESKKVELSLEPSVVNDGIVTTDLSPGFLLPMTVKSKEDHGYLMETGVGSIGAFITFKDAQDKQLQIGQVVIASVLSVAENGRSLSASLKDTIIVSSLLSLAPTISGLLPGNLVRALVTASSASGINVKLFGLFDGTIDSFHMDHEAEYKVGQHIKARLLWDIGPIGAEGSGVILDDEAHINQRKFALSAIEPIVKLEFSDIAMKQSFAVGAIVQATVLSTIEDWGVVCSIQGTPSKAFTHISACSDSHVASLPSSSGSFQVGSKHQARVVGHSPTDQIIQLSFQQSVLSRTFMRVSEMTIGDVVKCTIKSISPKSIILDLNGSVDGVVFPLHFADIPLKKPEKKYKVGQALKARIWKVDPDRNRIVLSLKKSLVQSELAIVGTLQDARVGVVTHGTVTRILEGNAGPSAILVDLFGHIRAYVPISEAMEARISDDSFRSTFFLGKCVKVRLTRVDYETGRITASIKQASESYLKRLNVDAVQIGETVKGRLAAVHQDVVVLELEPSHVRALIGLNALSKERKTTIDELRTQLTEGEMLDNLKVVDKSVEKGIVILGGVSAKVKSNDGGVKQGSIVNGKVTQTEKNVVLLHIGQNVRARLHVTDCVDDYGNEESTSSAILPKEGSQVSVYCLAVRGLNGKKADVSMRPSRLQEASSSKGLIVRDEEISEMSQLKEGVKVRGFVKAMAEKGGLFVEIGRNVTARVMISELFDAYIKDWISRFTIGQLVEGTITSVQVHQNKVEMSLRKEPGKKSGKSKADGELASPSAASSRAVAFAKLEQGQKIKAFVKSVTEYGLFLQIEGTELSGLAHKSQLSDDNQSDNAMKAFNIGDKVKAKILKVDLEKKKLSFGLKPSLFDAEDFVDSDDDDDDDDDEEDDDEEDEEDEEMEGEDSDERGEDEQSEAESSDVEMDTSALLDVDGNSDADDLLEVDSSHSGEEDESDEDEGDEEGESSDDSDEGLLSLTQRDNDNESDSDSSEYEDADETLTKAVAAPALALPGGISWSAQKAEEEDTPSSSSDEEEANAKVSKRDLKKKRKARAAEQKVYQEDLTANLATKAPESTQDFERLLLGSPDSSYLWIQFISFQLQLGDVVKAREVGRKALQVIGFREEQEKFNVWIALLNLENTFGSEDTLEEVYKEACAYNDDKVISLKFAEILEKSDKIEKAGEQWKRTTKKFGFSSKVWVEYHRFCLRIGRAEEARNMIARSMQSLEKRKHVKTIVAFALDDFRMGDAERGRTIFEGLVDTYPKRLDIWWQYIDQESRKQNVAQARELFERILSMKQSSKKVKSVLKKWLEFEKKHGDQRGEKAVLSRARRFVEERSQKDEPNGKESGEESGQEE